MRHGGATLRLALAANVVHAGGIGRRVDRLAADEVRADVRQILSLVEFLRQLPEPDANTLPISRFSNLRPCIRCSFFCLSLLRNKF